MTNTIWAVVGVSVFATLAMATALVIVLASGDDDSASESAAPPFAIGEDQLRQAAPPEELDDFRECLEDEGAGLPNPGEVPQGADLRALQEAFEACRDKLPEDFAAPGGQPFGAPLPQN